MRSILGDEFPSVNQLAMCYRFEFNPSSPHQVVRTVGDGGDEFMAEMSVLVLLP